MISNTCYIICQLYYITALLPSFSSSYNLLRSLTVPGTTNGLIIFPADIKLLADNKNVQINKFIMNLQFSVKQNSFQLF